LAAENFVEEVNEAFIKIELQPASYKRIYKHFYEIKLLKYPYSIVYFIDHKKTPLLSPRCFITKEIPRRSLRNEYG
jgi:hypothetical protein